MEAPNADLSSSVSPVLRALHRCELQLEPAPWILDIGKRSRVVGCLGCTQTATRSKAIQLKLLFDANKQRYSRVVRSALPLRAPFARRSGKAKIQFVIVRPLAQCFWTGSFRSGSGISPSWIKNGL